tara:strand:- start:877 stop:1713 length:837 start_codon:yes stop_codon:yes gene_type:complete
MNSLRQFIREALSDSEAQDIVGKYLWPLHQLDRHNPGDRRYEVDTEREAELRRAVIGFVMNHQENPMSDQDAKLLFDLSQTNLYRDILPKIRMRRTTPLYRGVSVSDNWFKRNYGMSYDEFLSNLPNEKLNVKSWKLARMFNVYEIDSSERVFSPKNPDTGVMSWTRSLDVALKFATGLEFSGSRYLVPLIFEARGSDTRNKMFDISGVYKLAHINRRSSEREALSIGPVRVIKTYALAWNFRKPGTPRHFEPGQMKNSEFDKMGYHDISGAKENIEH